MLSASPKSGCNHALGGEPLLQVSEQSRPLRACGRYVFWQNVHEYRRKKTTAQFAWAVLKLYALVYGGLYVALFVLSLPVNLVSWVVKSILGLFG